MSSCWAACGKQLLELPLQRLELQPQRLELQLLDLQQWAAACWTACGKTPQLELPLLQLELPPQRLELPLQRLELQPLDLQQRQRRRQLRSQAPL